MGLDESEGAAQALRWAVSEGAGRDWQIRAILAWDYLDQHQPDIPRHIDLGYDAEEAGKNVATIVDRAVGAPAAAGIELEVICDTAGSALIDRSNSADLLVVGSRGLGGFKRLHGHPLQHRTPHDGRQDEVGVGDEPRVRRRKGLAMVGDEPLVAIGPRLSVQTGPDPRRTIVALDDAPPLDADRTPRRRAAHSGQG